MTKVKDIYDFLCRKAPLELQMEFDNSGFQLGRLEAEVKKLLLSLDVTGDVVEEAIQKECQLIISHHPLIFHAVKAVTEEKLLRLAEARLSVISMHTNLDIAAGGVNDVLMELLGGLSEGPLDEDGCGRIGHLPAPVPMKSFLLLCKERLRCKGLRYYDAGKPVSRLAVMGGSGGDSLERAHELGCDTYVTADVKYHQFLAAREMSLNLIDGDHFCTENPVIYRLAAMLRGAFPDTDVLISERHRQVIQFL